MMCNAECTSACIYDVSSEGHQEHATLITRLASTGASVLSPANGVHSCVTEKQAESHARHLPCSAPRCAHIHASPPHRAHRASAQSSQASSDPFSWPPSLSLPLSLSLCPTHFHTTKKADQATEKVPTHPSGHLTGALSLSHTHTHSSHVSSAGPWRPVLRSTI